MACLGDFHYMTQRAVKLDQGAALVEKFGVGWVRSGPLYVRPTLKYFLALSELCSLIHLLLVLAYFTYFVIMKTGLFDLHAVCISVCLRTAPSSTSECLNQSL
jgi:hypothetical protein